MVSDRVDVNPYVLEWAAERAGLDAETAERVWVKWRAWLEGDVKPTVRQAREFARRTHVPFDFCCSTSRRSWSCRSPTSEPDTVNLWTSVPNSSTPFTTASASRTGTSTMSNGKAPNI